MTKFITLSRTDRRYGQERNFIPWTFNVEHICSFGDNRITMVNGGDFEVAETRKQIQEKCNSQNQV
jgi:hypothetical protein